MEKINSFKDLIVWQKGMQLAEVSYLIANLLPESERYGLSSQIKRSAISIPSNIAEGHKRGTKDFVRFLRIAFGSTAELETQLLLSAKVYSKISTDSALALTTEVQKILSTIIKKLESK